MLNHGRVAKFIVKQVQSNSFESGFQLIVGYEEAEQAYNVVLSSDDKDIIVEKLWNRKEVSDVLLDEYGFDVVLNTKYAPLYDKNEYE